MDEKIVNQSMELILNAGNGKSLAIEAFKELLTNGNVDLAREKLKQAGIEIGKAHDTQTSLLQKEMSGENFEKSILLIHAQDHFMNALTIRDMVSLMIDMYERLSNEK
ncbi:PTS lactose/cellobiose transporter subunit IIA [Clostridium felsineum]|uniref:Lichenan-specific phosphotransferase enzyme IIA component n=1 Tax=Clostridium felsineum TaxID=36839 RepID=A0A1S8LAW0_9CLOT|nr:PTS lactose/cellobiose transporter subunit IIA [Clostridium felsineum]MCR3760000.1 PTS lactose/cellobiose transporter subunit IIA [Clostridium felsineum]URZ04491.1 Lichenan-specific phosphotransferase enzyme IIA component [Clostridium felsineum]URZ09072.1 Lichenan-specific phosphotransferase enzyme IIA component [Clostridium felsineum]URZ13759.1 Lichenan-specific phosphotransferase enzyme IIA component [Clostridium felsineum]URZ18719.1 Lichenan-specific phosphotransferase enzyme IIA compone